MNDNRARRTSNLWTHSLKTLTLIAWLCVWTQRTAGQVSGTDEVIARVGETATLPASVTTGILTFSWYRGTAVLPPQLILSYVVSGFGVTSGPQSTGRESGYPNGTLYIRDLRTSDTGNYTVNVILTSGTPTESHKQLRVYESVSIPVIQAVTQNPVENGSLVLVCNASGTDVSYQWNQDGKLIISGGRINITSNSQTLTLSPCTRTNSGTNFTCGASNAVSHSTSSQYTLTVSYGPDTPVISVNPKKSAYEVGSAISFSCTATSYPPALYTWLLNGQSLLRTGRELAINSLTLTDSGNYTCNTSNNITHLSKHAIWGISVLEPVTKPRVTSEPSQLVENRPAKITCVTSTAAVTILWSLNSTTNLPGNIIQSPDNRTLTIINVSRGDSGIYQCVAKNPISNSTSDPQPLIVAYGPEDVKIEPPGSQLLQVNDKLSLSCTARSFPEPRFQWLLNNTDLNKSSNIYIVDKVTSRNNGNYTCVAHNMDTGLFVKASVSITVNGTDPSPDNTGGLSAGAIVGIVIGVLAVVIIVCVLVYIFVIKKPASGAATSRDSTEMASNNKGSASPQTNGTGAPEIQYSSVNFVPKRGTPAKPIAPENTVYSEVRR
ncbi:cell adhesion molecule CEACAM5-like isoform X2 [Lissotriton helveticus]